MDRTNAKDILGLEKESSFSSVSIGIAPPETILSWSRGEVKNPETINYRSFKPEKGGLFCERIFGPTRNWECNCGKYKRVKHKGIVCDRCGVEVTHSRVRRERMGHLELAVPVSHVWFFKSMPSRMSLMLDMTVRQLERVIYFEDWIVTDPGDTPLEYKSLLSDDKYLEARDNYGDAFEAAMGAEAIKTLLQQLDLNALYADLEQRASSTRSSSERKKLSKRLRLVKAFCEHNMQPEWMVLDVLPVIPPDLRPLVPLEGGRFATSDLNDLYRRVINRNNRLKNLLQLHTPEVIIRNEKRMLQEAVDALLDNGRHGRSVTGTGNRPLKSLSDMLRGKQGRFRQNLLGKRVDYSGRSVIVVGPELKMHQCGLPKKMAMVLFEPFIIRRLKERGHVQTVRSAKKMIERGDSVVWDILDEVTKGHPVLLNRAPTLHRLSIQAFEPVLIEGEAIQLHPLACSPYNADFDGDQMAVHIPLSNEAQLEAKTLMLATTNSFAPSSGDPINTPSQDMTLGCYYLTYYPRSGRQADKSDEDCKAFNDAFEVLEAYENRYLDIHEVVMLRNPDQGCEGRPWADPESSFIRTTVGRCIFNEIWPDELGFYNELANKKTLGQMVKDCYDLVGNDMTNDLLDRLKDLGFRYSTKAGLSMGMDDMIIPQDKWDRIEKAQEQVNEFRKQRQQGVITDRERYNKTVDIWTQVSSDLTGKLSGLLEGARSDGQLNPVFAMLDSGARGSKDQIRQLAVLRGLMAKPSGEIIERPILSNFKEGLSVLEYFLSAHGARKGLADTALKTADSGYLTRKLVDVAQDVICCEWDCQTPNGVWAEPIREGDEEVVPLKDRIVGRFSADNIYDPLADEKGALIVAASQEITEEIAYKIIDVGIEAVHIRSVLTCEAEEGVCAKCYGKNLATNMQPAVGDSLGILAAQSIGEPGTQLTMRTFHYGGTAAATFKEPKVQAESSGSLRFEDTRYVKDEENKYVILNRNAKVIIEDDDGLEIGRYQLVPGAVLSKGEGGTVEAGEEIARWDPYNIPIITETAGWVSYRDLVENVTYTREVSESGTEEITVLEHREDLHPQLVILNENSEIVDHYSLPGGAHIMVEEGVPVKTGLTIARTPRQVVRSKDITGGLPRVTELFEARRPKELAEIARIDGIVEVGKISKGKRNVTLRDPESEEEEVHSISVGKSLIVFDGDFVRRGQPLTDGAVAPHDLLEVCGPDEVRKYLVNEVQEVYRLQGVEINDKHIEIVVRQMMRKVRITEAGSTEFMYGEQVDRQNFMRENARVTAEGGQPAEGQPLLLGITKASLDTESFISAASFQDTTRVLTEAASSGNVDYLKGFKENVIMGHLIPAGTGHKSLRNAQVKRMADESEAVEESEESEKQGEDESEEVTDKTEKAKAVLDL